MKLFSEIGSIVIAVISGLWLYHEPSYEPLIALLTASGAILSQAYFRYKEGNISTLFGKVMLPLIRRKEKNTPIASIVFDTLSGSKATHHEIRAWNIWNDEHPTGRVELRHKVSNGSWVTFDIVEGHHPEFSASDVDSNGNPELLVRFACGGHTRVLKIFRINENATPTLIPGAEIGSDWPEIEVDDLDGDGYTEVYAKQRNWEGAPSQEFIQETYKYTNGQYSKQ